MPLIFRQACQIISQRFSPGRKIRPGRDLKLLVKKVVPHFQPDQYSRLRLAGFHNNTLAVYLHVFRDRAGRDWEVVEKNSRRAWGRSGFFPEVYFYENIASSWGGRIQAPRCYALERGSLTYRLFIEKIAGARVNLDKNFEDVLEALDFLQTSAPAFNQLPGEAGELLYFNRPPSRRFRGDYAQYLGRLGQRGLIPAATAAYFESGLSALAEICAAFPTVLNHMDLMPGNVLINDDQVVFIDWEKYYYAPAGFSQGNWLYSIFRKKENQLNDYLARWRRWLEAHYRHHHEREERILAGLFCYFCFVLEYLTRRSGSGLSDEDQNRLTCSGQKLWAQLSLLQQPGMIQAPWALLSRLLSV